MGQERNRIRPQLGRLGNSPKGFRGCSSTFTGTFTGTCARACARICERTPFQWKSELLLTPLMTHLDKLWQLIRWYWRKTIHRVPSDKVLHVNGFTCTKQT